LSSSGGIPLLRAKDVNFWYTAFVFKAGLMYMCQKQKENINSYRNFLRVLKKIIIRSRVFENWASVCSVCVSKFLIFAGLKKFVRLASS
jgi:hypothetical protein